MNNINYYSLLALHDHPNQEMLNRFEGLSDQFKAIPATQQGSLAERIVHDLNLNDRYASVKYIRAFHYMQQFLFPRKLTELQPERVCQILQSLNGHVIGRSGIKSSYKKTHSIVFDARIFPATRTKDTFLTFEKKLFTLMTDEEKSIWKEQTQKKIWYGMFSQKRREIMTLDEIDFKPLAHCSARIENQEQVPDLMNEFAKNLIRWVKEIDDPYQIMSKAHHQFVKIHPFDDGNGRTARLLMIWIANHLNVEPLFLGSEQTYFGAICKGEEAFTAYLKGRVNKTPNVTPEFCQVIQTIVENTLQIS